MMYDIIVTVNNSPTKVRGLGYLINADSREQAVAQALENAQTKADKPYSRYKRCTFTVKDEDVIAKRVYPDKLITHRGRYTGGLEWVE